MVLYNERLPDPIDDEDPYDYMRRLGVYRAGRHLAKMFQSLSDLVPDLDPKVAAKSYEVAHNYFGDQHNGLRGTYDLLRGIHTAIEDCDEQGMVMSPQSFMAMLTIAPPNVQPELPSVADIHNDPMTA
jgi:hypothetical protein